MIPGLKFELNLNKILAAAGFLALAFVITFFVWWQRDVTITNDTESDIIVDGLQKSLITGLPCENLNRRPLAVMLASDPITRPLSGISQADIVFEMPVTPSGGTRMMAVYQCESPKEIGSIRSAREDFIPLVAGLGAGYAHWGGGREALKKLDTHVVDNIDAMKYEGTYYYRRAGVKQPHNGFVGFDKLWEAVGDLGYGKENKNPGYIHKDKKLSKSINNTAEQIEIGYSSPFDVVWNYNNERGVYSRLRSGKPEVDRNNSQTVEAATIIVMRTDPIYISKDYMNVRVVGEGDVAIYQDGIKVLGKWKKDSAQLDSKLFFYDTNGKEMEFLPGKM